MKNRLQFNRIPFLYSSGETLYSGTSVGLSGRETALSGLTWFTTRRNFIPLIGEPIVVRYIDDKGRKQLMLAIGKATGSTADDTYGIEYHVIDSAKLQEDIDLANEHAAEALELASGATKDTADYLTILKNMILSGIGLTDGSYFDNNGRWDRDPSHVGLYDAIENANFIGEATSFREADDMIDKALKKAVDDLAQLSGATEDFSGTTKGYLERIIAAAGLNEQEPGEYPGHDETHFIKDATSLDNADVLLDAAIWNLSADTYNTIAELSAGTIQLSADTVSTIEELSAGTVSGLEFLSGISENIINAAGLEADGTYEHKHDANFIDDATSLFDADVILDTTIAEFSANTVAEFEETNNNLSELSAATVEIQTKEEKVIEAAGLEADGSYPHNHNANFIDEATSLNNADVILDATLAELSANTMAADQAIEDAFNEKIDELSANTMAADQVLDNKIDELSANTMAADQALEDAFNEKIDELSANTMAADQALQGQIDELANRKVLGVSAITVETLENGDSKVSLVINEEDDKVLTQNALGLKANVSLVYSREDKKIYLKGKNDITISTIDATDFIKDGMLSAASVFTASEADHEQYPELVVGKTYIKLLFNVDGEEPGRANPVFVSAEDLVDIYTVDPESHTFMEINDYLIKLNVDEENGLASYNYARNISAVTANIISATGLNMGEQGGYPGHDETHYIKNAGSLDQADVLLDEAIWGNNQGLAELSATTESFSSATHTVIENILAGTGLNTMGTGEYHGHDETHYIKNATSLDNADVKLDEAIWETSGLVVDISNRVDELSAATREFSANTHNTIRELSGAVINLSSVTESFSAHTVEALSALSVSVDERIESGLTILSGVVENYVEERLSGLNFDEIYEYIDSGDTALKEHIDEVEEVTAGALNDLNERVGTIETHFNGEYIPLTGYELASGLSEDELIIREEDTVNDAFGKIQKQILDNEETIAGGLNDLNDKITVLSGVVITLEDKTEINALSGVVANNVTNINNVSGSVKYLSGAVVINRNDINSLSASLIDDELVIATALNDLNRRVVALSGNSVDFSNYYTKTEVDAKYYNTANTYNKTEVNNLLSSVTNVYSSSTSFSAVTSTSARTSFSAVTSTSAITSTSARTSFSAITATSARTSLSAVTSLSAQTALSAMTAKNLDLRYTTSNALTNLNFAEFLTIATINGNATLSIASIGLPTLPANGVAERHVIIENTGSSAALVTIANDARVKITPNNANFNQFAIDAGGRGELNVLITYNGSAYTIYVITT